jgi:hypothetical protein
MCFRPITDPEPVAEEPEHVKVLAPTVTWSKKATRVPPLPEPEISFAQRSERPLMYTHKTPHCDNIGCNNDWLSTSLRISLLCL